MADASEVDHTIEYGVGSGHGGILSAAHRMVYIRAYCRGNIQAQANAGSILGNASVVMTPKVYLKSNHVDGRVRLADLQNLNNSLES